MRRWLMGLLALLTIAGGAGFTLSCRDAALARLMVNQLAGFGVIGGSTACTCTPSYATGDRTGSIAMTASTLNNPGGPYNNMVDGGFSQDFTDSIRGSALSNGELLKFDFGSGNSILIDKFKFYAENSSTFGAWDFEGSNDDSTWSSLEVVPSLVGDVPGTEYTLDSTGGYRYYRLIIVSYTSNGGKLNEIEFSQCECNA